MRIVYVRISQHKLIEKLLIQRFSKGLKFLVDSQTFHRFIHSCVQSARLLDIEWIISGYVRESSENERLMNFKKILK